MSTEGTQPDSLGNLSREVVGQIRFDPSEGLKERLEDLYLPTKRDLGRRSLFLSSQYRLVTRQGPGGVVQGEDGQVAERIRNALRRGNNRPNHLGSYMRQAEAMRGGRDFFALQFAIHLDREIAKAIDSDEMLSRQPILEPRERALKVVFVYDARSIFSDGQRERAVRSIGRYVTGQDIIPLDGGNRQQKSPNRGAYTTNARFTFTPLHHAPPRQPRGDTA